MRSLSLPRIFKRVGPECDLSNFSPRDLKRLAIEMDRLHKVYRRRKARRVDYDSTGIEAEYLCATWAHITNNT